MILKVSTSDEQVFEIEESLATMNLTIKNLIEDVGNTTMVIPLPNVAGATFAKVMEYCKNHAPNLGAEEITKLDDEFVKLDQAELFDLVVAANYLNNKGLLDLTCQAVAKMIKGKSAEEIRKIFNITNDYTPEEEAAIRKENQWAFDA